MFNVRSKYPHRGHEQVRKRACSMLEANINIEDMRRWRAKEERHVKMLNDKGFWEGGVIPNTCSDVRRLASFQL